ncbi:hypothetical protein TNCV_2819381 [Trichonephila clavipes]|nr:hypothetical protein TNCV_2819381 [Trichonephila clavipes]
MRKTVKINGYDFDAVIETGSTVTLIRESVYQILGRPTLNPTKIKLTSFSGCEGKQMAMTRTKEAVRKETLEHEREEVEKAKDADAHRQTSKNS